MRKVPKYRKQKNMAQQMKAILIILMVVLAVYVGVSAMLLERTRKQAIQEMDEMSKLYTDELDNRFLHECRADGSEATSSGCKKIIHPAGQQL